MIVIYHFNLESDWPANRSDYGRLVYQGQDASGNRILTLARGDYPTVTQMMLEGIADVYGFGPNEVIAVDLNAAARLSPEEISARTLERSNRSATRSVMRNPGLWPKVFYICYGAAHSSVVAAAVHCGLLPKDRMATPAEIAALAQFDRASNEEIGRPVLIGQDEDGREVFALGLSSARWFLHRTLHDLVWWLGLPSRCALTVDALAGVTWRTRLGGFLSRRLGLVRIGRPLCLAGVVREYPRFLAMAESAGRRVRELSLIDSGAPLVDNNQEKSGREETSDRGTRGRNP